MMDSGLMAACLVAVLIMIAAGLVTAGPVAASLVAVGPISDCYP